MKYEQLTILLVDDDEIDRITVKRAFKKAGLSVEITEAENGESALAFLQKQTFAAILLDYRLPDRNALELICEIRNLSIDSPLIVLTGQGDEEIAVEIMKAGAADYLTKGKIEPKNLVKAIQNAIRIHRAEKAVILANQRLRATNELLTLKNQELEKQQQQIKLKNLQLQESYNLKSQFLATMSHELRTPMNAIMGFSQLLLRNYQSPISQQQKDLVQRIFDNSRNLLEMINEMLDFSKIEAGKLELNPQKFDLANMVKLTVEELRSLAVNKQIELKTKIDLSDRCIINDSYCLKRIVVNLLSNAIKFTDEGEVVVKVWEVNSQQIAIAVRDTGIGIAPEHIKSIFQAFRQVDQSFTRRHSGTGLGLAISQSLVQMMGGTIAIESQPRKGSTFTIEIPREIRNK